jgi:XTP/dITP diphosphohydrolase
VAARLVLLVTSPRVPAGLLTYDAWTVLRAGVVMTRNQDHPQRDALAAAGIVTEAVDPTHPPAAVARLLLHTARESGTAVWLAAGGGDDDIAHALAEAGVQAAERGEQVDLEVVYGSWDTPGARLLDVVATMDRLRSPGGCPWDAEQTHDSLAPYLLEEAYEAFQAIEDGDGDALRDELGDVLLQVAFHARLAAEAPDEGARWTIDDVAAGLVDKLVRRHPHVFGDRTVSGADEVVANWDAIKTAERGGRSGLANVPMSSPALTLAATLQRKAAKLDLDGVTDGGAAAAADDPGALLAAYTAGPTAETAGALLWALVAAMRGDGIDAEAALRARARAVRDQMVASEDASPAPAPAPATQRGRLSAAPASDGDELD